VPAGNVIVFGRSLGGAVAAWLAERVEPGILAVESTFVSAPAMAQRMFPFLPARLLCRFDYDALGAIRAMKCPVVVSHSRDDEMIPFEHGQRLYEAAPEPKLFIEMRGGHNAGGLDADARYQDLFRTFAVRYLPQNR
jgi:hypothetical protein